MRWESSRDLERFARYLRQPRDELANLVQRLRQGGWEDFEIEDLALARAQLGQVQGLLLRAARRIRERSPEAKR